MQWSLILTITYKTNGNKRETFKYLGYQKKRVRDNCYKRNPINFVGFTLNGELNKNVFKPVTTLVL